MTRTATFTLSMIVLFGPGCAPDESDADSAKSTGLSEHNGVQSNKEPGVGEGEAARGQLAFTRHCAGCHGMEGEGSLVYPPLAGSEFVIGDPRRLVTMVWTGIFGPITVAGIRYDTEIMPSWRDLIAPAELADIVNHLRTTGVNAGLEVEGSRTVSEAEVQAWTQAAKPLGGPVRASRYEDGTWRDDLAE